MSRMGELYAAIQQAKAIADANDSHIGPFIRHSRTSLEAAVAILPDSGTKRRAVYDYILSRGTAGATDEEQQTALGMNPSTQRPRRVELWQSGLVYQTEATRPTKAGRSAVVWFAREQP